MGIVNKTIPVRQLINIHFVRFTIFHSYRFGSTVKSFCEHFPRRDYSWMEKIHTVLNPVNVEPTQKGYTLVVQKTRNYFL